MAKLVKKRGKGLAQKNKPPQSQSLPVLEKFPSAFQPNSKPLTNAEPIEVQISPPPPVLLPLLRLHVLIRSVQVFIALHIFEYSVRAQNTFCVNALEYCMNAFEYFRELIAWMVRHVQSDMFLIQSFVTCGALFWYEYLCRRAQSDLMLMHVHRLLHRAWLTLWKPVPELISILGVEVPEPPEVSLAGIKADAVTLHWVRPGANKPVINYLIQVNGVIGMVNLNDPPVAC